MKRFLLIWASALLVLGCQKEVYHDITVSVNPSEGGSVSPSSGPVLDGTSVSFKATPKGDYVFSGWSGSISGTENPKTVTVTQDMNVTANFTLRSYPLALTIEGDGTVAEKVISTKSEYQLGTVVELTANPSDFWLFDHWEGDMTGSTNPVLLTVSSAKNVKAVFVEKTYPLAVEIVGNGTVNEEVIATKATYLEGTIVRLTAVPDEFWKFDHWEGGLDGSEDIKEITVTGEIKIKAIFVESDPGIEYTNTEYVSPENLFIRLGLGVKMIGQLESNISSEGKIYENEFLVTKAYFEALKERGIKTICIPVTWLGRVGPAPDYIIDPTWMDRVKEVVGYAEDAGLNASIDLSYDSVNNLSGIDWLNVSDDIVWLATDRAAEDPKYRKESNDKFIAVWKQIARAFRDKGDFLMFHCFTEPGAGNLWSTELDLNDPKIAGQVDVLNERYQLFVDAVRSTGGNNASRWLVISPATDIPEHLKYIKKPEDYVSNNRIIYSFHFFEPGAFTKDGLCEQWGHTANVPVEQAYVHGEEYILSLFETIHDTYISHGQPVVMTEFGCTNRHDELAKAFHLYWYEYVIKAAHDNQIAGYMLDCGGDENVQNEYHDHCFDIMGHQTGRFVDYGEEIFNVAIKAMYCEDEEYTLDYIYNNAPENEGGEDIINIPDPIFRRYILGLYDTNNDGQLSRRESWRITNINIITTGIHTLDGIESFENLVELHCPGTSDWIGTESGPGLLTSLDISHNTRLKILQCNNNHISKIDLSNNTELEDLCIRSNGMTSLDLSHNPKLLWYDATFNQINTIDLSENKELCHFYHCMNGLTNITGMESLYQLEILSLNDNCLTSLDVTHNTALKELQFYNNDIASIDLSYNQDLKVLSCCDNPRLSTIYVHSGHQFDRLEKDDFTNIVYDSGVDIPDATFRKFMIEHFDSDGNHSLSMDEMAAITEISACTDNIISLKGIEYCINLESLICRGSFDEEYTYDKYYGVLEDIDVSKNTKLTYLDCSYNRIKSLNVSGNTDLLSLDCHNNLIEKLDVSNNKLLETLTCRNCRLTALNVQNNNRLHEIDCQGSNRISEIDISNCPEITLLNANGVGLNSVNTSSNRKLDWLGCADGTFTSLDFSNNPELFCLYISGSRKIKTVDLTKNPNVQEIFARDCDVLQTIILKKGCSLTSLEIDDHTQIVYE